jgi:hypothetical protein
MYTTPQEGLSCLAIAAFQGHRKVVEFLCSLNNSKIKTLKDNKGVSPLGHAQEAGRKAIAKYLTRVGCR